jgi:hypothetical protein
MNGASQIRYILIHSRLPTFTIGFLLLICVLKTNAQNKADSAYKAFRNAYNDCEDYLRKGKLDKAIKCYEDLIVMNPKKIKSYVRLAEINYQKRDLQKTLFYANKAIDLNANEAYSPMTYLANKMKSNRDDEIAILILNRLTVSDMDTIKLSKAQKNRQDYSLAAAYDKTPVPGVNLYNIGDSINTKEDEYFPSLSLDGNTLAFTRKINGANEDFFIAQRDTNLRWSKAKNMGTPPNTGSPDGAAMLSADGYYIFYTRCDVRSPDGIEGGGCDLVFSYREDSAWSSPQYFGYTINTTAYEGQPCLSSDNKDLYFVSNREGGYGGLDIWVSRFVGNFWSKPVNLGPTINTSKNESSPFIHPDNETLYFTSDGHPGLGATDIFISRKNKNGTWKRPINIGAPINSENYESSVVVDAKGEMGYFAANRKDSKGGMDIFAFDVYPAIAPVPTVCIKGYLYDKYFKTKLYERNLEFIYTYNGLNIGNVQSNEGDGSYAKALQMGKTYLIKVDEPGYRPFYKTLKLTSDTIEQNIYFDIRLRQPGYKDSLLKTKLKTDSTHLKLDSNSILVFDSIVHRWPQWTADSASVVVFLKGMYYCGDSIGDTLYKQRIDECNNRLEYISRLFEKNGIECKYIMQDLEMIIYNDEEDLFDEVDVKVVEYY